LVGEPAVISAKTNVQFKLKIIIKLNKFFIIFT
jgi:hypothetical protein